MRNATGVQILQPQQNLAEIDASLILGQFGLIADGVEEISSLDVLHNKEEVAGGLDNFVHLDEEGVADGFHNFDLSADAFDICFLFYAFFA